MKNLILLIVLIPTFIKAQENPLEIFKPLENYIWIADGQWQDNSSFKQELSLEFALEDKIVKVKSLGFTNKEQTEFGVRNHGIRQFDSKSEKIRFWEFDVFGNLTEGTVKSEGKNIIYSYDYEGISITEMWIYKNQKTYDFIVGIYDNNIWVKKFLQTEFKRKKKTS